MGGGTSEKYNAGGLHVEGRWDMLDSGVDDGFDLGSGYERGVGESIEAPAGLA